MKKRLSKAREIYLCGIAWNSEFLFQRMYMALLIIGCMFLKNFSIRTNIIYILLHVVSLYFFGYKKSMWECSLREKIYQTLYFISNIIIIGVSIFQGKTWLILITIGLSSIFAGILGLIILFFTDRLIISGREYTEKNGNLQSSYNIVLKCIVFSHRTSCCRFFSVWSGIYYSNICNINSFYKCWRRQRHEFLRIFWNLIRR